MNPDDYAYLTSYLREKSGLALGPGKEYLLEGRLTPLCESSGFADLGALARELKAGRDSELSIAVIEAMAINETSFFRDKSPFEDLREHILPGLIAARGQSRSLRLWCAAAGSGQEPYSVLMTIGEWFPQLEDWTIDFIATDISASLLMRAEAGVYTQFEVQQGLPFRMLGRYFGPSTAGWEIKDSLRNRIKFRRLNLLDNVQHLGPFDVIFCRNVLLYFEADTRKRILDRLANSLRGDGFLLLGAAETVLGISDRFRRDRNCVSGVYLPKVGVPS